MAIVGAIPATNTVIVNAARPLLPAGVTIKPGGMLPE